ncbi:hypothetical protein RRG08_045047 [Elysia crispata]|uniref:Uncharacterized protein n=1 Tax=Elysia crispata TaxID=231223 RepID=A0AAE0XV01_9GAST|nr:hypothetical protein RRG08_045047 [Elysia crispata]
MTLPPPHVSRGLGCYGPKSPCGCRGCDEGYVYLISDADEAVGPGTRPPEIDIQRPGTSGLDNVLSDTLPYDSKVHITGKKDRVRVTRRSRERGGSLAVESRDQLGQLDTF